MELKIDPNIQILAIKFTRVALFQDTRSSDWRFNDARFMHKLSKLDEMKQSKFCNHENYILLNKRPSCRSMQINVSSPHHGEFNSVFKTDLHLYSY